MSSSLSSSSSSTTFYTCSPYSTPQLLRNSGEEPLEVTIHYIYEVDIPTTTSSSTEEEDDDDDHLSLAIRHISETLLQRIATISNLVDCSDTPNPFRRQVIRQLRYTGRGSNSIIGISSNPMEDYFDGSNNGGVLSNGNKNGVCQQLHDAANATSSGGDGADGAAVQVGEVVEYEKFTEGVSTEFSGSAILMEEEGGERESDEDIAAAAASAAAAAEASAAAAIILAQTKVDGVVDPSSVVRSVPLPNQSSSSKEAAGVAYNYLSTQSEIQEFTSVRTQPTDVGDTTITNGISLLQSSVTMSPPILRNNNDDGSAAGKTTTATTTPTTTCTLIHGQMTLFISNHADPYENLDGRILDAIKADLNDEMIVKNEFLNEVVLGIRLLEPALDDNPPSASSVTTTTTTAAAAASSNTNDAGGSGFTSSYASIGVIAGLGGIFLILIGLFAYTSRPNKRRRHRYVNGDDPNHLSSSSPFNYGDDKYENEMDPVSSLFLGKQQSSVTNFQTFSSSSSTTNDDDDEASFAAQSKSSKRLALGLFHKKSKSRDDEGDGATSNLVAGELIKSDNSLLDEEDLSVVDMDAPYLLNSVEESKSRKTKPFGRLFGRKRHSVSHDSEDVMIDDDIVIEKVETLAEGINEEFQTEIQEDTFAIETTRTAPLRPMSAYISPTAVGSRPPRFAQEYCAERTLQTCASGALSSCMGMPIPEIGEDGSYDISALTDYDQYSRRGLPGCAQRDGEEFMRAAKGAVSQCVAPTDDQSVSNRSIATRKLALRQPNNVNTMDVFADCWNPFEGNFWKGWFE